jgi:hypothetical protein
MNVGPLTRTTEIIRGKVIRCLVVKVIHEPAMS